MIKRPTDIQCLLFGHKISHENYNMDSGYYICLRCNSHEGYHPEEWEHHAMVFVILNVLIRGICFPFLWIKNKVYERCWYCHKTCRLLWFSVGKHDDHHDIPF